MPSPDTRLTEMAPAGELFTAAKTLRDIAADATGGPWETTEDLLWIGGSVWGYSVAKEEFLAKDPAWIALAHPGLAEPLAAWLEAAALRAAKVADPRNQEIIADQHALKVARLINGGAS